MSGCPATGLAYRYLGQGYYEAEALPPWVRSSLLHSLTFSILQSPLSVSTAPLAHPLCPRPHPRPATQIPHAPPHHPPLTAPPMAPLPTASASIPPHQPSAVNVGLFATRTSSTNMQQMWTFSQRGNRGRTPYERQRRASSDWTTKREEQQASTPARIPGGAEPTKRRYLQAVLVPTEDIR